MSASLPSPHRADLAVTLGFFLITFGLFARAIPFPFLNVDDRIYVVTNSEVQKGLTGDSIDWSFTSHYAANWHPLTWLSLQLDYDVYGLEPSGFHRTNIFLHALNTALLFWVLLGYTGQRWPSALVAALFGWHPLHVESVVWIAERKDVLSTFFWLLTMAAYRHYAIRPSILRYLGVVVLLALGLLAKPMVVTLPFVLLLLDYWPLQRIAWTTGAAGTGVNAIAKKRWYTLVAEKIPMLVLVGIDAYLTADAQAKGGAIRSLDLIPFPERVANALITYIAYLGQTLWPENLACFYPFSHPAWWNARVIIALALIVIVTAAALSYCKKFPYLAVGWFWYLGTLVPVIGLVQVGEQAMADRYTYVPLIGIFIMAAWGSRDLIDRGIIAQRLLVFGLAVGLVVLAIRTWQQIEYWKDDLSLWKHAVEVTVPNVTSYDNLAIAQIEQRDLSGAASTFSKALQINPLDETALVNRGSSFLKLGEDEKAFRDLDAAVKTYPNNYWAQYSLAVLLSKRRQSREAVTHFLAAIRIRPGDLEPQLGVGAEYLKLGELSNAERHLLEAVRIKPETQAYLWLSDIYLWQGDNARATECCQEAVQLDAKNALAFHKLSVALYRQNKAREALAPAQQAVILNGSALLYHTFLALLLDLQGDKLQAQLEYDRALRIDPKWPQSCIEQARRLATDPEPSRRYGTQALELALMGCHDFRDTRPDFLDVLAVAYAEVGEMDKAVETAQKALSQAPADQETLRNRIENHLRSFKQGLPIREKAEPKKLQ